MAPTQRSSWRDPQLWTPKGKEGYIDQLLAEQANATKCFEEDEGPNNDSVQVTA